MIHRYAADALVLIHMAFILFVVLGGFLALKWPRVVWLHLPAAAWGALIEFAGWICPLTPLENSLRIAGGGAGYSGGFIEEYIVPLVYPAGLTPGVQLALGAAVIFINAVAYGLILLKRSRRSTR
jgi:hypothetical protein